MIASGMRMTEWTQEKPASTYLISLVVAPLAKVSDRWHGMPVDYYVYEEDRAKARALFGVTPDMIEVYSRLTRVRYPWNKYAQVTVADFVANGERLRHHSCGLASRLRCPSRPTLVPVGAHSARARASMVR